VSDLDGYVLTFAPHPLMMRQSCVVEQLNEHEFTLTTGPPGYFSGRGGRMLLAGTRPGAPLTPGTVVPGPLFDATVLAADGRGVTKLKFSFHRPLDSPGYYFYVCSPQRPACRLRFGQEPRPPSAAEHELFAQARGGDVRARAEIVRRALPVAVQTADPIQAALREGALSDEAVLAQVKAWWCRVDVPAALAETQAWNARHAGALRERDRFFTIDALARRIVRSDLYLTGEEDR